MSKTATALAQVDNNSPANIDETIDNVLSGYDDTTWRPMWFAVKEFGFVSEAEEQPLLQMEGHIIAIRKARRYSVPDPDTGRRVPVCVLSNRVNPDFGINLDTRDYVACATCPQNNWGSATNDAGVRTKGKACREKRLLMVLRDGDALPVIVAAPPTSVRIVEDWKNKLITKGIKYPTVRVTLKVKRETGEEKAYGVLQIHGDAPVPPAQQAELVARIQAGRGMIHGWLQASLVDVDQDDIGTVEAGQQASGLPL
jgi:hypothetical protein